MFNPCKGTQNVFYWEIHNSFRSYIQEFSKVRITNLNIEHAFNLSKEKFFLTNFYSIQKEFRTQCQSTKWFNSLSRAKTSKENEVYDKGLALSSGAERKTKNRLFQHNKRRRRLGTAKRLRIDVPFCTKMISRTFSFFFFFFLV